MAPFLGFGGLAGFLVFTVLAVIHALKRTGRAKRLAFISAIAFGLFTAAHELYHHLSYTGGSAELRPLFCSVRERELSAPEATEEKMANRFAAALLMPAGPVREMIAQGMYTGRMARHFGVSVEAMDIRLQELGLGYAVCR